MILEPRQRRAPRPRDSDGTEAAGKTPKSKNKSKKAGLNARKPKSVANSRAKTASVSKSHSLGMLKLILGKKTTKELTPNESPSSESCGLDPQSEPIQFDECSISESASALPANINVEVTVVVRGSAQGQPDQDIIDPNMSFEEFISKIREMVGDNYSALSETASVEMSWKWERRIVAQTGVKKVPTAWSALSRQRNWNSVQQLLRETAAKKNGTHNMLLKIRADVVDSNAGPQEAVRPDTEPLATGRQVYYCCIFLMIDNHHVADKKIDQCCSERSRRHVQNVAAQVSM